MSHARKADSHIGYLPENGYLCRYKNTDPGGSEKRVLEGITGQSREFVPEFLQYLERQNVLRTASASNYLAIK